MQRTQISGTDTEVTDRSVVPRSPEILKRRYFPRFRGRNANTNLVDTVPISVD